MMLNYYELYKPASHRAVLGVLIELSTNRHMHVRAVVGAVSA